jgi:hypothetical protein
MGGVLPLPTSRADRCEKQRGYETSRGHADAFGAVSMALPMGKGSFGVDLVAFRRATHSMIFVAFPGLPSG